MRQELRRRRGGRKVQPYLIDAAQSSGEESFSVRTT